MRERAREAIARLDLTKVGGRMAQGVLKVRWPPCAPVVDQFRLGSGRGMYALYVCSRDQLFLVIDEAWHHSPSNASAAQNDEQTIDLSFSTNHLPFF